MKTNGIESQDFSKYDKMSDEELAAIRRRDLLASPEEQLSADELIYISQLYCRRTGQANLFTKSAEEAFAQFEQQYMPKEPGEVARQQEQEEADLQETMNLLRQLSRSEEKNQKRHGRTFRRYMLIAAIVAVVVSLMVVPVNASGQTVFKTIVIWAKETFQFISPDQISTEDFVEDIQFQEFLRQNGVATTVPSLIPKGYTFLQNSVIGEGDHISCQALYQLDKKTFLSIAVDAITPGSLSYVEQSGDVYEGLKINGTEYFLFSNLEHTVAVWNSNSYQHIITAPISKEEMKIMLYSIPKE
jgi:hypothetical protein